MNNRLETLKVLITEEEDQINNTTEALYKYKKTLHRLRLEYCSIVHNIDVGDIVETKDSEWFLVTEIDPSPIKENKPYLKGNPQIKCGKFGDSVRKIYGDYKVLEKGKK